MPYKSVLNDLRQDAFTRTLAADENTLVALLGDALKTHPATTPVTITRLSNALKGNIGEFIAWELGERHWKLFTREVTWTANADSPLKHSSDPGIDILAYGLEPPSLLILEVKTSNGNGADLVIGNSSSLQNDFAKMFQGDIHSRLYLNVAKLLNRFRYIYKDKQAEESIKRLVGTSPSTCTGISIYATLICTRGTDASVNARKRAFDGLKAYLHGAGWDPGQCNFLTLEVGGVDDVITKVIERIAP